MQFEFRNRTYKVETDGDLFKRSSPWHGIPDEAEEREVRKAAKKAKQKVEGVVEDYCEAEGYSHQSKPSSRVGPAHCPAVACPGLITCHDAVV